MGKRGPPKKPTAIKKLEGTYRPDRALANEMAPPPGVPACPEHLDEAAKAEWRRVVPELDKLGVLTLVDGAALEAYVSNYALATWYQNFANRAPMLKMGAPGKEQFYPNPAASAARKHWTVCKQFLTEFGLTPASRTRIATAEKGDSDETSDFLGLRAIDGGKR